MNLIPNHEEFQGFILHTYSVHGILKLPPKNIGEVNSLSSSQKSC